MSKEQKAVLHATEKFVESIITEVYGQRATRASVQATALRVMETLPSKEYAATAAQPKER